MAQVAALLFWVAAAAAPRPVTLSYLRDPGAEACPDERWIRQAVSARLGADPFVEAGEVRIEARISKAARGLIGTIAVTDNAGARLGRRELASATGDCLELASAMELAMAIAVDPQYLTRPPPAEPAPVVAPAPVPPPPASVPAPVPQPPPVVPSSSVGLQLHAGALGAFGLSPNVVPAAVLGASLRWSRLSVGIEARADLASTVSFGPGRVTSSVLLGSIVPCALIGRFAVCGLISAGAIQFTGEIVPPTRRESSPLVLAGLRGRAELPLTATLSLQPFVDVQAVLIRTTVVSGDQPVWVTSPVAASAGLALGVQIF
jgi:hypothetical protein